MAYLEEQIARALGERAAEAEDRRLAWRLDQLLKAGYTVADAEPLAANTEVDLHHAIDVMKRCGSSSLARAIIE